MLTNFRFVNVPFENFISNNQICTLEEDKFAWLRDDEFARQTIAGINPVNIERVKVNLLIK
jgi:Lipoxygenase